LLDVDEEETNIIRNNGNCSPRGTASFPRRLETSKGEYNKSIILGGPGRGKKK